MRKFLIFVVILVVAGSVYYFGFHGKDNLANLLPDKEEDSKDVSSGENLVAVGNPDPVFAEPVKFSSLKNEFSSNLFSFKYPDGFKVYQSEVSGSEEVFTIENSKGSGFQVFLMAWDESGSITPERIWKDEPEADVIDPKNAKLDGVDALVFYGYNGDIGETFEVWSVRPDRTGKGRLYQITGPKTAEDLIISTLETWIWK